MYDLRQNALPECLLVTPPVRSNVRSSILSVMFFFQRLVSELPRPIALKLCHMIGLWLNFIIPLQKFGGRSHKKIWGPKTCKIRSIFATSDFDREYLRNGSTYPKSKKNSFNHNHFHVGRKKLGELWSKNNRDPVVHIDPPKWIFFRRLYFGP